MKIHFYRGSEDIEQSSCGTFLGESSLLSEFWNEVNCKRCLKLKTKIIKSIEVEEIAILDQMASMVDWYYKSEGDV